MNGLLGFAVDDRAVNAPVGCLHELKQRLLVEAPLLGKLAGFGKLAARKLERHLGWFKCIEIG